MNDLIRPTLYDSFHRIWPVSPGGRCPGAAGGLRGRRSPDTCAAGRGRPGVRVRRLPGEGPACRRCGRGDLLATFSAGAYGMAMASNYNSRLRAAEVLVTGRTHRLIRRRETYEDLVACEEDCLT